MADNSNINIKVEVTGQDATAVQQETARRIGATTAAYSGPQNAQAYAATRADAIRAAQITADATQRNARVQWRHNVTQPRRDATGAIERDDAGNPVMEVIGSVTANEQIQPQAVAGRLRRFQTRQAQQTQRTLQEAKDEAASHRIASVDRFGGRWRPGTVEWLLRTAEQNPDTPEGRDALREAKQMTGFIRKGTTTEFHARRGESKRDDLLDRLATARGSVDVARANARVQRILRDVDTLADDIRNARRTSLATPEGKRRLSDLRGAVTTIESEATRQTREDTRARDAANRSADQAQRFARTIETAGRVAGIRAAVGGAQTVAQSLIGGNVVQAGGGLLHTIGSTMHHVGLGRMAAARAAGATGAAVGAGRFLSGAGAAIMIGAKLVTAGLERGYENSERADRFMGQAEPLFDLRARQYAAAQGTRYTPSTADSLAQVTGKRSLVSSISVDRANQLALGAAPTNDAERDLLVQAGVPENAGRGLNRRTIRNPKRAARAAQKDALANARAADRVMAAYRGDPELGDLDDMIEKVADRAQAATRQLARLRSIGMKPEEALAAYAGFSGRHGMARRSLPQDVTSIIDARRMGVSSDLYAESMRVGGLAGEGERGIHGMARSLTQGGVMGAPQHGVIASFLQQMASEQARGLSPSTYVAANAIDSMSKSGVKYPVMGTVREMAGQAVEHNLAGPRAFAQALLNTRVGVNAYMGRSYDEGTMFLGENDAMDQTATAFNQMSGVLQGRVAMGIGPGQTKELVDAFNNMKARDLTAVPEWMDETSSEVDAFLRFATGAEADWNMIGNTRNLSAIKSGQTFKIALDEAANALRSAADAAAVFAIGGG